MPTKTVWSKHADSIRMLGELVMDGLTESRIAARMTTHYHEPVTRLMVASKLRDKGVRNKFTELFTPDQVADINSRFSLPLTRAPKGSNESANESRKKPVPATPFLGNPTGLVGDALGMPSRPRMCTACDSKPRSRGNYCDDCADTYYQPRSNATNWDKSLSKTGNQR